LFDVATILCRTHPEAHFLVLGYPNEERYRAEARDRGLDGMMTFPGRVPYNEASRWICLGEVAVSPKRSLTEANGKLLNYMACGRPVVASDTPVNRELLGHAGIFAAVDDAESFAERIMELLIDPDRAKAVGVVLQARASQEFAWPVLARRLERVYREAVAESHQS
jgi:glycosyltransferase involved in cell wall biosynthesis